jgi:hypothetical protein
MIIEDPSNEANQRYDTEDDWYPSHVKSATKKEEETTPTIIFKC